jgi:hypothetical protein
LKENEASEYASVKESCFGNEQVVMNVNFPFSHEL